jgi:transcriptional regulator with XRE-family HTH domain
MTLRELATELGIPITTPGIYERGDRSPDFDFVLEIANILEFQWITLQKGMTWLTMMNTN